MSEPGNVTRPAYRLYQLAWAGLDWLYPPYYGGCGARGSRWCSSCQQNTRMILGPLCQRCGQPVSNTGPTICRDCKNRSFHLTALRSWAQFSGPLQNAIHRLKYKGDLALGDILARPLIDLLQVNCWEVDLVIPVPVGVARQAQRGYNQAALLALPVALGLNLAYRPKAMEKIRDTRSQVGLSFAERRENVKGAFRARAEQVREKRVLLVDDVTTSGATLNACAKALFDAGANHVFGITLARAGSYQQAINPSSGGR